VVCWSHAEQYASLLQCNTVRFVLEFCFKGQQLQQRSSARSTLPSGTFCYQVGQNTDFAVMLCRTQTGTCCIIGTNQAEHIL
jgi:hypothetical protein